MGGPQLGIRWNVGDVSDAGFEALRLSIWGAWRLFGRSALYAVCVHAQPVQLALSRTGDVPDEVQWRDASGLLPDWMKLRVDARVAEEVGWTLAPPRLFEERHELALDNACVLWKVPAALGRWLEDSDPRACVVAEDVRGRLGQFAGRGESEPRSWAIRGLPPRFDVRTALEAVFADEPGLLSSEADEHSMQLAALARERPPHVVRLTEVSVCSPFPPHLPYLGSCGAWFVGLNAKQFPWKLDDRPAEEYIRENWRRQRPGLYARVGILPDDDRDELYRPGRGPEPRHVEGP